MMVPFIEIVPLAPPACRMTSPAVPVPLLTSSLTVIAPPVVEIEIFAATVVIPSVPPTVVISMALLSLYARVPPPVIAAARFVNKLSWVERLNGPSPISSNPVPEITAV